MTQNFARGSPTQLFFLFGSIQNQTQILIVQQKNKLLPDEGQQLNYKYNTDQGRFIILRQIGYRTQ